MCKENITHFIKVFGTITSAAKITNIAFEYTKVRKLKTMNDIILNENFLI